MVELCIGCDVFNTMNVDYEAEKIIVAHLLRSWSERLKVMKYSHKEG